MPDVVLADNGVVSLNLPINAQLIGTTASRSTHPRVLRLVTALFRAVLSPSLRVTNPLWNRTRAETLALLAASGTACLIPYTYSCTHTNRRPSEQPFCGSCSQCIDRRFATVAAGLEEYDPARRYDLDVFRSPLTDRYARTMVLSYVRFGQAIADQDDMALFVRFPELFAAIDPADPSPQLTAGALGDLLRRQGRMVNTVLEKEIGRAAHALARRDLPEHCLLRLVGAPGRSGQGRRQEAQHPSWQPAAAQDPYVFRREGDYWRVTFAGVPASIKDVRGMTLLRHLLQHPGELVSVFDLDKLNGTHVAAPNRAYSTLSSEQLAAEGLRTGTGDGPLERIDAAAVRAYREKLKELGVDIDDAEEQGNSARREQLLKERDLLLKEIQSARYARGGTVERYRQRVSKNIREAIARIESRLPACGVHLRLCARLGAHCIYVPTPSDIAWRL